MPTIPPPRIATLPQDAEDYVHRIGRTARLGARGEAISFACENYAFHLPEIEEFIGYPIDMLQAEAEQLPEIEIPPPPPRRGGRSRSGRSRGKPSGEPRNKGDDRSRKPRRRRRRKPRKPE